MSKIKKRKRNKANLKYVGITSKSVSMDERYNMSMISPSEKVEIITRVENLQCEAKRDVEELILLYYGKNIQVEKIRNQTFGDLIKNNFARQKV